MATTDTRPSQQADDDPRWSPGELVARLAPVIPGSRLIGWLAPLGIAVLAGVLRLWDLGNPHAVVFDETYYAKDSLSLLKFGVEHEYADEAKVVDKLLLGGSTDIYKDNASFIVHPQVGKWMIALGYLLVAWGKSAFGGQPFDLEAGVTPVGWRISAAIVGTLAILVMARVARRMTRSTMLGCLAALLLTFDGLEFVQSRVALLDIFLMFWILAAFACLVADRDHARRRLARLVERHGAGDFGPWLGIRGWRIAAGVCLGLAVGTKWSGLWTVAAFGLLTFFWDVGARRAAGVKRPFLGALKLDSAPAFASIVVLAAFVYVASWWSWFATPGGWDRDWTDESKFGVPAVVRNWWHYHVEIYNFHTGLTSNHDYESSPWGWMVLARPVAYFYESPGGCGEASCSSAITGLGTPAIWWVSIPVMLAMIWLWLIRRDWRAATVVVGLAASWVPWLQYPERTMFFFYALPMLPFIVLALTIAAGWAIGPKPPPGMPASNRRIGGTIAVGTYTLLVAANFLYFLPIFTAQVIPYASWAARMWLPTWI
ncbi:MAG: phospholipid carrier-dependent glycosyltransferase [Streptosporangiales bacterium]|nr:phospholipid carrier-dependent glycosyltransferase [Streptosporangiales bacterium]